MNPSIKYKFNVEILEKLIICSEGREGPSEMSNVW